MGNKNKRPVIQKLEVDRHISNEQEYKEHNEKEDNDKKEYESHNLKDNFFDFFQITKDKKNNLNLHFQADLVKNSYAWRQLTNTCTTFKSINDILFLISYTKDKSIVCIDLNKFKIITEIKNAHTNHCYSLRHYLDSINKRDILISLFDINIIKLWDIKNFECIICLKDIYIKGMICSVDLLEEKNINYIITSNYGEDKNYTEPVKVYDVNEKFIKLINESNERTLVLYTFYDNDISKNFIITGNYNNVIAYDFTSNTIYHKYSDVQNDKVHTDIIIFKEDNITKLIESCYDGFIRIWDFHSCLLLNKINLENYEKYQFCLCLWDDSHLFVGCLYKIILVNYKENKILGYYRQKDNPLTLNKVYLSKFGECLISQLMGKQPIKFWIK